MRSPGRAGVASLAVAIAACGSAPVPPASAPPSGGSAGGGTQQSGPAGGGTQRSGPAGAALPARGSVPPARPLPRCSSSGSCREAPLPTGYDLHALWAAAPDDVWAVGDGGETIRWDGADWSRWPSGTDVDLLGIWGAAPDDVWAVGGFDLWDEPYCVPVMLHWDGAAWSRAEPAPLGSCEIFYAAAGTAPDDVWVVGHDVQHWDGARWTAVDGLGGGWSPLYAVWARARDDVWAGGESGTLQHFDGRGWTLVAEGEMYVPDITSIWGSAADDVWFASGETLLHWDGRSLTRGGPSAEAVWGRGGDDVWAARSGELSHWDGRGWTTRTAPTVAGRYPNLLAIAGTPDGTIFGAGAGGEVLRLRAGRWESLHVGAVSKLLTGVWAAPGGDVFATSEWGQVARRGGGAWGAAPLTYDALYAVWGSGDEQVWVAGEHGCHIDPYPFYERCWPQLWRWNGLTWERHQGMWAEAIVGFSGTGPDDVWAAGAHGSFSHWDGRAWRDDSYLNRWNNDPRRLAAIWAAGPGDVWAVGENTILHLVGGSWQETRVEFRLHGIWGSGARDVWAVGDEGMILRWRGAGWERVASGTERWLGAVSGSGPDRAYAVGSGGLVLRWDGRTWSEIETGEREDLLGVDATHADVAYAVGDHGLVLALREPALR